MGDVVRTLLVIHGVVQGIGMRPFVYRLAHALGLTGVVQNVPAGVRIEIQGAPSTVTSFVQQLHTHAPALARISDVDTVAIPVHHDADFVILPSEPGDGSTLIPPDLAMCAECVCDMLDARDRRFRYPFTTCTLCGPRFTVIRVLPYDRATTTMANFALCDACDTEYRTPTDRRFHAETIACATCGPRVWLEVNGTAEPAGADAIAHAATLLRHGAVLTVQGLGGFHLVCDATNDAAVQRLRVIKQREHKPLALMMATVDDARRYVHVSESEARLLTSMHAPIVLARKKRDTDIASGIAPGNTYLGVMLPYAPLHHLLVRAVAGPLVVTSGNRRGEPLCITAEEIHTMFADSLDGLLLHDRPIHQRCDDSVYMVTPRGPQPVRRSRGYVPLPVPAPVKAPLPILGVGADLKNTFCLLGEHEAFMSQHIGDMGSVATQQHFTRALAHFTALLKLTPAQVAHDLHPNYVTSRLARETGLPLIGIQHHHAHIAACLAENGITGRVIGVAFDGTGYGTDGAIWGGEFLVADLRDFRRVIHFEYLPLPGGEGAIRHPHRLAVAYLLSLCGAVPALPCLAAVSEGEQRVIKQMVMRRIRTPMTSSCGRLFDAVAAIVGLRGTVTYEAQAAIELEAVSYDGAGDTTVYPYVLDGSRVRLGPLLAQLVADVQAHVPVSAIGWRFHQTLAEIVRSVCKKIRAREHVHRVALSGGCWQNRLLLEMTVTRLQEDGFIVYTHKQVPTNDGGVSLGQAVVAGTRLAQRM